MIRLENLAQFNEGLDRWLEAVENLADGAYRGLVVRVFKHIVEGSGFSGVRLGGTPQWTGNLAASWKLTVGGPSTGYSETIFKDADLGGLFQPEPFSLARPNVGAQRYAKSIGKGEVGFVRLGADVYITNNAPYALMVELNMNARGQRFLRPENSFYEMTAGTAERFGRLGEISERMALQLAKENL